VKREGAHPPGALTLALRMLARREHTRAELEQRLAMHATRDEVCAVLDRLQRDRLQSDARFAEAFVAARKRRYGNARLRHDLRSRGVAEELIEQALSAPDEDELARATAIWRRKFDAPPTDARDYARQARFLHLRGFAQDMLRQILRAMQEE
jgi:regulatory protein